MNKYILTLCLALSPLVSWAGTSNLDVVNVSRTLTLTSPSAVISMTGASATAYLRNISATTVSATTVSATNISATNISSRGVAKAWGYINAGVSPSVILASFNVSSTTRLSAGKEVITFSQPMTSANYAVTLSVYANNVTGAVCGAIGNAAAAGGVSPTMSTFQVDIYNCSGGQRDTGYFFTVFGN